MSDAVTTVIVKSTFILLLFASVVTWALVLIKAQQRWKIRRADARFARAVGGKPKLGALGATENAYGPSGRLARSARTALQELDADPNPVTSNEAAREVVQAALSAQIAQEKRDSEAGLAVLATIGSTSPFVGLFGTVWGIIHALRAIGHNGNASLEVVAGPIGEALVATGLGIAVAVPAVLAYNFFIRRLKVQVADLDILGNQFLAQIARRGSSTSGFLGDGAGGDDARREARV